MDSKLYFEDLEIGTIIEGDEVAVDRSEMLDFARRFDPQPFHLDKSSGLTGLDRKGTVVRC